MKLLTPNRSNERHLTCAAMGVVLLLVICTSPYAEAFPLSRFTERVSGPGINERGQDDNLAENIVVNRPGFFGKAETSGNNGAVLPGGSGGPSAEAILDSDEGGLASTRVTYHFGVVGPPLPAPIPLLIDAVLLVETEPVAFIPSAFDELAHATIGVFAPGVIDEGTTLSACSGLPTVCQDRRRDLVFDLGMPLGVDGTIGLSASVFGAGGRRRAVADPFIRIDPTFEFVDLYQIILSSNVSNTPPAPQAVPEGSTLSLLSVGLVALTFLGRSKWGVRMPRSFRNG